MYIVTKRFCEYGPKAGLFLLEPPTGSGKSYSVINYIYDSVMDGEHQGVKYIFITGLKKNLEESFRKKFRQEGRETEFEDYVLFLNSSVECVLNNLTAAMKAGIPNEITSNKLFVKLRTDAEYLNNVKGGNVSREAKELAKRVREEFENETEPAFRHWIERLFQKDVPDVKDRKKAIHINNKWSWLKVLYPAVLTHERQILLLSVNKFLVPNTTFVSPAVPFFESDFIDNSVIVIDEFDATKSILLDYEINNAIKPNGDFFELFTMIYSVLVSHSREIPPDMLLPSRWYREGHPKATSLRPLIDELAVIANEIYDKHSMCFNYWMNSNDEASNNCFLFQDHRFHSILNANKPIVSVNTDSDKFRNIISFSSPEEKSTGRPLYDVLGSLRGFFTKFCFAISNVANNYYELQQDRGRSSFTKDYALRTVLNQFIVGDEYVSFLARFIQYNMSGRALVVKDNNLDFSFFNNGFRYYSFENDMNSDTMTNIMQCSFTNTPEKLLLSICNKAKVIGISATAGIPSVIANYDIEYLRTMLKDRFYSLGKEDISRIKGYWNRLTEGYSNININCDFLGGSPVGNPSLRWHEVFATNSFAQKVNNKIEQSLSLCKNGNGSFYKERYFRIALAYKQFHLHSDIRSFLCILNIHPKPDDYKLDSNILSLIFEFIRTEVTGSKGVVDWDQLTGEDFDNKKASISARLSKGEKLFVISAYPTVGAGQNLQYTIPSDERDEVFAVNDRHSEEKDFDAIYLDKPTNVLTNLSYDEYSLNDVSPKEYTLLRYICDIEYIKEVGELSVFDSKYYIDYAFRWYVGTDKVPANVTDIYSTKSVKMAYTMILIQAVGRICRTSNKKKNVYIYADQGLVGYIDLGIRDGSRLLNPEFLALLDAAERVGATRTVPDSFRTKAGLVSECVYHYIRDMLRGVWTKNKIVDWQELRRFLLMFPTADDETAATMAQDFANANIIIHNFFIPFPEIGYQYFFWQKDDFSTVGVDYFKSKDFPNEVSDEAARLDILMRFPVLRNHFERNGFATDFVPNKYILCPIAFQNLYKGALGEEVGRVLFADALHVPLSEIEEPEYFEKFDFYIDGTPIFVDFKNWKEYYSDFNNREYLLNKIKEKADVCGGKCAIIANIIADDDYVILDELCGDVRILGVSSLLNVQKDGSVVYNDEAMIKIRGVIDEFSAKN